MSKITLDDVKVLGEGPQIKQFILKSYSSINEFHKKTNLPITMSTLKGYLASDVITAESFKNAIAIIFNIDYNSQFTPKNKLLTDHVQNIYDNITEYNEESDQKLFDYLVKECIKDNMPLETAMMYRAKARNYYINNKINLCRDYYYDYAIKALPKDEISKKVFFYSELAYDTLRENLTIRSREWFEFADESIRKNKNIKKIDDNAMHYYHYWKGKYLFYSVYSNKYDKAHESFEEALKYATKNFEKASAISSVGYIYLRQKKYEDALPYFERALEYYDETNILTTASTYNYLAATYRGMGDYKIALEYSNKAMDMLKIKYSHNKHLIYTGTQVEILMDMGDVQAYKIFFDALLSTMGKQIHKMTIINSVRDFTANISYTDCLDELTDVLIVLLEASTIEGFINGMYECIGHIAMRLHSIRKGKLSENCK